MGLKMGFAMTDGVRGSRMLPPQSEAAEIMRLYFVGFPESCKSEEVVWDWGLMKSAYLHRERSSQLISSSEARLLGCRPQTVTIHEDGGENIQTNCTRQIF